MTDESSKVLDLDEILGEAQNVKIKRKGQDGKKHEYLMRDIDAFSTFELMRIQKIRRSIAKIQMQDELSEAQAVEVENLFNEVLAMLSAELPIQEMSYTEKSAVLAFYFSEVRKKKVPIKNK